MKVTLVSIQPTMAANQAGRPALTPELLAATGARYSRSNEGLDAILSRIDFNNPDKSVDSIFRMIDYGHQSIADMAPIAMFLDGASIWLAYYVWSICATAGGQESSTRYIQLDRSGLADPEAVGIPRSEEAAWLRDMDRCFEAYNDALLLWEQVAIAHPEVVRLPQAVIDDSSELGIKKAARIRRNYAFDRARYFLPVAAKTNLMLVMSARAWVQLCQHLLSHPASEAQYLGGQIKSELPLASPRLLKHAEPKTSLIQGLKSEFDSVCELAISNEAPHLDRTDISPAKQVTPTLAATTPEGATASDYEADLTFHDNRYAWTGATLRRTAVRFGWDAVALAEIRDLNRHRTGTKYCPLVPQGFYFAEDQLPNTAQSPLEFRTRLEALAELGREMSRLSRRFLSERQHWYPYWSVLGTQYPFEHITTADKFIYEAELRTGIGAHFRYAQHLKDVLALWYTEFPTTRGLILEGSAEPE